MLDLYSYSNDFTMNTNIIKGSNTLKSDVKIDLIVNGGEEYIYHKNVCKISCKVQEKPSLESEFLHRNEVKDNTYFYLEDANFCIGYELISLPKREEDKEKQKKLAIQTIYNDQSYLSDFQQKILEDMVLNDEQTKIVALKDYTDYLPVKINCSEPIYNKNISDAPDEKNYDITAIDDYFKFPVKDDMLIKNEFKYYNDLGDFTIETNANIMSPYAKKYGEDIYKMYTTNSQDVSTLYLAFEDGKNYQIPKEYKGIYKLNIEKEEGREYEIIETITHQYDTVLCINTKTIEKVYPTKENEIIKNIFINKTGDLCVLSQIDNTIQLTYLNPNNYKTICTVNLSDDKHQFVDLLIGQNGLIATYENKYFQWIDDKSHTMILNGKHDISQQIKNKESVFDKNDYFDFIYDDDKLYILENNRTSLQVNIIDKNGNSTLIAYSFPLKLSKHELENKNPTTKHFYIIEKAAFSK